MLRKLSVVGLVCALAVVVPALANATKPSTKCKTREVAYIAQGTYVSSTPTLVASTAWSGKLTIKLKSVNRHFAKLNGLTVKRSVKGTEYLLTGVTGATVKLGKGIGKKALVKNHITIRGRVHEVFGCMASSNALKVTTISVSK